MNEKKYGPINNFNEAKERAERSDKQWQWGAVINDLASVPLEHRLRYAPLGVRQYTSTFDTNGCASRDKLNIFEGKLTWFHHNGMHPANQKWGRDNKYVVFEDGMERWKLNDAFIEILSGTEPDGNSMYAPIEAIYKYGVIPAHMLPLEEGMTREQYLDPDRVTMEMIRLGKEFNRRFQFNFEQVPERDFQEARKEDYLASAGHGWPTPENGIYPRTEARFNHAFATATPTIHALDGYEPHIKLLATNFKFFEWGYSLSITSQNPFPNEVMSLFEVLQQNGLLAFFADAVKRLTDFFADPRTASEADPVTPSIPSPEPKPVPAPVTIQNPPSDEKLIAALIQVESGGDDNAIGDKTLKHKAYGCLQIRQPVCDDVNRAYGTSSKAQDMLNNRTLSVQFALRYWTIYKCKTDEEKARIWNGGPTAKRVGSTQYKATNGYWAKVKKLL